MFDNYFYLLLFWLFPFIVVLFFYSYACKRRAALRFVDVSMFIRLFPVMRFGYFLFSCVCFCVSASFIIIALSCPMFGEYFEEVSRKGCDVFVLLDVSRSMLAEDASPNRLERAKSAIRDLLDNVVGDRVGLLVFAGKPVIKAPLTTDRGFYNEVLNAVDTSSAPSGGTAIGDAIRRALAAMPPEAERDQAIVLITDGEDHESMPLEAAKEAAAKNIKIIVVALGDTVEGSRIPVRDERGNLTFLKYNGQEIWSKVDDKTLREIAEITNGTYIPAGDKLFELGQIYSQNIAKLSAGEFQVEQQKKYHKQFQPFLVLAIIALLAYAYFAKAGFQNAEYRIIDKSNFISKK
ncbi:MAG: VWA domain-containing protein [Planctomycetaceae bacterium]|jgi:Ca-activated chloride channel family protein|nr:VWA domain-containing protein [Planctomycetaceae bacterium]